MLSVPDGSARPRRRPAARLTRAGGLACLVAGMLGAPPALAQTPVAPVDGIYTCTDDRGRRLTADRPIFECRDREQRIMNRDGSPRGVLPPSLTADERAEKEARLRREAEARAAQADAVRRDRHLLSRYPNLQAHASAREAALDSGRLAIRSLEQRLRDLAVERKPLADEAEFYRGRAVPPQLRLQLDTNDATVEAQKGAITRQQAELDRVNALFDAELERLRKLWAGAAPGSLSAPPLPNQR